MKKKAQGNIDFSNPMNWWLIPIFLFILVLVLGLLRQVYIDTNCSEIINEKNTCCSNSDYWKGQYDAQNETITNCSNLIQKQINNCDNRINESVSDCTATLEINKDYIVVNKIFFAVYHILVIFLYIPLTINLTKIVFKVKLKKKWEELITFWQKILLITKIIFWIVLTLIFISYILIFLFSNPI